MTPERHNQISRVFDAACRLGAAERTAYLDQACAGDKELRAEVEDLLAHDEKTMPILPVVPAAVMLDSDLPRPAHGGPDVSSHDARLLPSRIGRFRVLRKIGEGGMGVVYEAEQDNPRRTVALKVIRPGVASHQVLQRFGIEAQILGRLQHPGIAQIHEAGTAAIETTAGLTVEQPYFAMEYVHGRPLDQAVLEPGIDTRARLEVFVKICDAVQHAHQKGVIHRDLKPGNILLDESGQPKILDFGVARLTDSDLQVTTLHTNLGQLIGTIPYMSPEQIAGDPHELDTRSDVYALGVLCYQLLTGRLPHDLRGKTVPDAARTVAEGIPARLSSINSRLRGDLETIVGKAMEKDKERRYQSASDLAEDIRRYLSDQPITARPPTTIYHLWKFAQRNKPLVVGVAATFVALVIGIVGTTSQAVRATRARDRALEAERLAEQRRQDAEAERAEAERQTGIARAVNDFLNDDLLAAADPRQESNRSVSVREILDRAAVSVERRFQDQPLVEAAVRMTLGDAYNGLGEYDLGAVHLEKALTLRRAALGEDHPETLMTMTRVGRLYVNQARYNEAEAILTKAVERGKRVFGEDDGRTLSAMNNLSWLCGRQGRRAQQESLALRVLEISQRRGAVQDENRVTALANLAELYSSQGRYEQAEEFFRKALEIDIRLRGEAHPETLTTMSNLSNMFARQGRYDEAEPLCIKTYELRRCVLGEEHPKTLASMNALAVLYRKQERFVEAEPLLVQALEVKRRVLGEEHPNTLVAMNNLANFLAVRGRYEESERYHLQALAIRRRVLGEEHPQTATSVANVAELYALEGRHQEAEPLYRKALELRLRFLGDKHADTLDSLRGLIRSLVELRRFEEAESLALEAHRELSTALGVAHPQTQRAAALLADLYDRWEKPDQAAAWRAKLAEIRAASRPASRPGEVETTEP